MLSNQPVILWRLADGRPPADDTHHTCRSVPAAAEYLSCRPFEVYRAIISGTAIRGSWYADLAHPRQVEGGALEQTQAVR